MALTDAERKEAERWACALDKSWVVCLSGVGMVTILSIKLQWSQKLFPVLAIADSLSLIVLTGLLILASMLATPNTRFQAS